MGKGGHHPTVSNSTVTVSAGGRAGIGVVLAAITAQAIVPYS